MQARSEVHLSNVIQLGSDTARQHHRPALQAACWLADEHGLDGRRLPQPDEHPARAQPDYNPTAQYPPLKILDTWACDCDTADGGACLPVRAMYELVSDPTEYANLAA